MTVLSGPHLFLVAQILHFPHVIVVVVSTLLWACGEQLTSFLWNCFSISITLRLVVRPAPPGVALSFFFLGSVVISASLPGACGARCPVLARADVTVLPLPVSVSEVDKKKKTEKDHRENWKE